MELEKNIISSLTDTENVKKAWDLGLRKEHFVKHGSVFDFVMDYWFESKIAPTGEVLKEEYPALDIIEPEESIIWLVEKVKSRYRKNKVKDLNEASAELTQADDSAGALKLLTTKSFELVQSLTDRKSSVNIASMESITERRSRYSERARFDGAIRGAPLGFDAIDEHISGIFPGEICTMGGYSGTGKTFAGIFSAIAAYKAGYAPYLVTLEVPKPDMEDRIDCMLSEVAYVKLLRGNLDRDELKRLHDAQEERIDGGKFILDNPMPRDREVTTLVQKALQSGSNYLIIDQLSFIRPSSKKFSTRDAYGEIMNDLKTQVANPDQMIPLYLMAQFNRQSKKEKGRGGMWNLAEAVFVEQYSDMVMGITQTNELKVNQSMYWDIFKCRRQEPKAWLLNWQLKNRTHFSVDMEIPLGENDA